MLLEIIFRTPAWGLFLVLAPLFGWLYWLLARYIKKKRARSITSTLIPEQLFLRSWPAFAIRAFCLIMAMSLIVLSLMEPVSPQEQKPALEIQVPLDEVAFFLDLSRSMDAQDTSTGASRLERAKEIIGALTERLEGVYVSLTGFAADASLLVPQTMDYLYFQTILDSLSTDDIAQTGSDFLHMAQGVEEGVIRTPWSKTQVIVLLTDGEDTLLLDLDLKEKEKRRLEILQEIAKTKNLHWQVVGVGSREGAKIEVQGAPVISSMHPELLEEIAQAGDGHFVAEHGMSLEALVENILAEIPLKELHAEEREKEKPVSIPLLLSFILILAALSIPQQVLKKGTLLLFLVLSTRLDAASVSDRVDQAIVLSQAERADLAIEALQSILNESLTPQERAIVQYDLATLLIQERRFSQARDVLQSIDTSDKVINSAIDYEIALANLFLAKTSQPEKAVTFLREARQSLAQSKEPQLQLSHLAEEIGREANQLFQVLFTHHLEALGRNGLIDAFILFCYESYLKLRLTAQEPLYVEGFWKLSRFQFTTFCTRLFTMLKAPSTPFQASINRFLAARLQQLENAILQSSSDALLVGLYQLIDLLRVIQADDAYVLLQNYYEKVENEKQFDTPFWQNQLQATREFIVAFLNEKRERVLSSSPTGATVELLQKQTLEPFSVEAVIKIDLLIDWIAEWQLLDRHYLKDDLRWAIRFLKKLIRDNVEEVSFIQLEQTAIQKILDTHPPQEITSLLVQAKAALELPRDQQRALALLEKALELLQKKAPSETQVTPLQEKKIPRDPSTSIRLLQEMDRDDQKLLGKPVPKVVPSGAEVARPY